MSRDENNNNKKSKKNNTNPNHKQNDHQKHRDPKVGTRKVVVSDCLLSASKSVFDQQLHPRQLANGNNPHEQKDVHQDSQPRRQLSAEEDEEMTKKVKTAKQYKKWNRRLKIFFCCLGYKKNKDSIGDVASIFAEFYADLNVSSSDFAAGMVLLSKYQAAQQDWIVKNGCQRLRQTNQIINRNNLNDLEQRQSDQQGPNEAQANGSNLPSDNISEALELNEHDDDQVIQQYLSTVPITGATKFVDISTAQDSHLINDLIYYMNYSLAIFGWPLQMVDDPCMLCCICPYLRFKSCWPCGAKSGRVSPSSDEKKESSSDDTNNGNKSRFIAPKAPPVGELAADCDHPIVLEDNCCGCNAASAECRLSAHNYEIIYVSYKVKVNVVPFLVAADHSKQTVVVAIRGSMSLSDMVTDMNGQTDRLPLDESGCPDDWLCHRGIARASNYVKDTLLGEQRILERAFSCRPDLGSNDYALLLCGHSLGAGVAAILGLLLRPRYPQLKAYLYSPPGGMLSRPAVEETKKFAIGIMLGNDIVPRLGVAQLERLRYHVLLSLKSSRKSSGNILARALCPSCCMGDDQVDYDPSQSLNLLHGIGGRSFDYNGSKIPFQVQPQLLYVPGKLIHIVKNQMTHRRLLKKQPIFQAVWTENIDYDRVIIGEGMFYDHLPNRLMHAMKMLFCKTLPANRDSSASVSPQRASPDSPDFEPIHHDRYQNRRPQSSGDGSDLSMAIVEDCARKLKHLDEDDEAASNHELNNNNVHHINIHTGNSHQQSHKGQFNNARKLESVRKLAPEEQLDSNGNGELVENKNLNHAH